MSLFADLFGKQHADGANGGLFSSKSKFAALSLPTTSTVPAATQPAAATSAAAAAQSGKKRRKQDAATVPSQPSAHAADAPEDRRVKKRTKKERSQDGAAPAQQQQQQRDTPALTTKPGKAAAASRVVLGLDAAPGKPKGTRDTPAKRDSNNADPATAGQQQGAATQAVSKLSQPAKRATQDKQQDDDARLPRTVFVGNLPSIIKRKAVAKLFGGCGTVESVRLRSLPIKRDPGSKIPRRGAIASGAIDAQHSAHAYVVFADEAAVDKALALNMQEFEGHHLRVDRAAPRSAKGAVQFDHRRSLFVGNLPLEAEDEQVIRLFGESSVEAVRIVRDAKTGAGKGVAFVLFASQEACHGALKHQEGLELGGRELRVSRVKRQQDGKETWQQGKQGGKPGDKKAAANRPVQGQRKSSSKRPAVAARRAKQQQAQQAQRSRRE